jgi:hypothetical protein
MALSCAVVGKGGVGKEDVGKEDVGKEDVGKEDVRNKLAKDICALAASDATLPKPTLTETA